MRFLEKPRLLISSKNFIPLLIVVLLAFLAGRALIGPGYFNMHDDLQMMRQLEMEKCFLDLQIPCRWVPDMGYGYGYPLFNFYPPLPYLIGEGIRVLGFAFTETVKILFILSFVASGITMYFLSKEFFGRFGGVLSSAFYIWAPYHAVDSYVRGAMNESWAMVFFPVILLFSYKLITAQAKSKTKVFIIGLALSWFGLFTSHNLMVMLFAPIFTAWCLLWFIRERNLKRLPQLIISGIWSLGLAAFFTLPVLLEKGMVQTDTLVVGYYEYTAHFVSISQLLLSRFWGYGPSAWGVVNDRMSFQIGWIHWILSIVLVAYALYRYYKKRKVDQTLLLILFFAFFGWFAAFMTHSRSTPIWSHLSFLKFVQFPWRFLTLVIFCFSFISGAIVKLFSPKIYKVLGPLLVLGIIIYSINYFVPEHGRLGPLTDAEKFSAAAWDLQQTAGIYDYLPNTAKTAPKAPQSSIAEILDGNAQITSAVEGTNWAKLIVNADSPSIVRLNILEFPNWQFTDNGSNVNHYVADTEEWGRMYVDVAPGEHDITLKLTDTPIRKVGNYLSLISWVLVVIYLFRKKLGWPS